MHPDRKEQISRARRPTISAATRLNLHLRQAVLPDSYERRDPILAVVKQNDHSIGVHGLADEELVVLETSNNLLGKGGRSLFELLDLVLTAALLLHAFLDLLHVALEMAEICLLVELGLVQAERVDNIDDLGCGVVEVFAAFFG